MIKKITAAIAAFSVALIAAPALATTLERPVTNQTNCASPKYVAGTVNYRYDDQNTPGTNDDEVKVRADGLGGLDIQSEWGGVNGDNLTFSWRRLNGQGQTVVIDTLTVGIPNGVNSFGGVEDFISQDWVKQDNAPWIRLVVEYNSGITCAVNIQS